MLNPPTKSVNESSPSPQPEIFLYKYLNAWRDAFTELTIYIEERLKNNNRSSENEKVISLLFFKNIFENHCFLYLLDVSYS